MKNETRNLALASVHFSDAARYLCAAMAVNLRTTANNAWRESAMNSLRSAVAALGYQIVPITTPQQDHERCLANRLAEDEGASHARSMGIAVDAPLPSAGHMNPANVQVEDAS